MSKTSSNKRIAKNTILLYFRMMFMMLITLYTSRVVLHVLGVEDFGIYNVVGGVVTLMGFLNGSLNTATQRYLNYEMGCNNINGMRKIFSMSLICYIGIALLALVLAETIGLWFIYNKLLIPANRLTAAIWVLHFSVISFVINLFIVPYNAAIIAHEEMSIYAYISVGSVVMKLMLVILLNYVDYDKLRLYAFMMMMTTLLEAFLYWAICTKRFSECHLCWCFDKDLLKGLFSFSGWMMSGTLTYLLNIQGVNILINMFFGPAYNAARAVSSQVNGAVNSFSMIFLTAVRPQIVKSYAEGNIDRMYQLVFQSSRFSFFLLFVMVLPLTVNMEFVLSLWLKKVPEHASLYTQLVLIDLLIVSAYNPIAYVSQAANKIKAYQLMISMCFLAVLLLTWVAYMQGAGAYITFVIAIIVDFIGYFLRLWISNKIISFPLSEYCRKVIFPILFVSLFTLLFVYFPKFIIVDYTNNWMQLIWCVFSTLITTWFIGLRKEERVFLLSKLKKK